MSRTLVPRLRTSLWLAALTAAAATLVEAEECRAQTISALAWAGLTEDLKPNPFSDVGTERNSGITIGATILFTSAARRRKGVSASWTRFDDDLDLRHLDVLGVLGLTRGTLLYLDLVGGISWARFNSLRVGIDQETSLDLLLGPVLGVSLPLVEAAALDLSVVSQFRWSPDRTDYLRVGARVGLGVVAP